MVTGAFGHTWIFIDMTGGTFFGQRFCSNNMIQPPAKVSLKSVPHSVIPECILAGVFAVLSKDIHKSPVHYFLKRFMHIRMKTNVS